MTRPPEAVIADDEEHLRDYLKRRLNEVWPELSVTGEAKNGLEALDMIVRLEPDVAFLDIKMPGLSGIDVAGKIMGRCRVVFVTSYDEYAVEAFENEAADYLLKPVTDQRLEKTVHRLKEHLSRPPADPGALASMMSRLMERLDRPAGKEFLKWIRVQHRDAVRLISVEDVICFRASDKYTSVLTAAGESLINTPIRQLADDLDPEKFWQIHRSTIVSVRHITEVSRSLTGRYVVRLKGLGEPLTVSRPYAHLFRQM